MPRNVIPFGVYDIHARADNRHIEHDGQDGWFASVSIWKGGEIPLTTCKFA